MTLDQSRVNHTRFEGDLNTINVILSMKDKHITFTRVTLLMLTKIAQGKVLFHIFNMKVGYKKLKRQINTR